TDPSCSAASTPPPAAAWCTTGTAGAAAGSALPTSAARPCGCTGRPACSTCPAPTRRSPAAACRRRTDVRYRDYLHLDSLLELQHPQSPPDDRRVYAAEHFFIVVHQSSE